MGSFGGRLIHWRRLMLANPLAFVAIFVLGGFLAFAYSYVPLHGVQDHKIGRLERRLLEYEDTIATLDGELGRLRLIAARTPDEQAVATLESDRDAAKREIGVLRAELKKAKRRTTGLERERTSWKGKVAVLEKQIAETPTPERGELRIEAGSPAATAAAGPAAGALDPAGDVPRELASPQRPESVPAAPVF